MAPNDGPYADPMGDGLRHSGLALTPVVLKEMAYFGPTIIAALVAGEMVANEDGGGALKTILVKGARPHILVTQLHAWHGPCETPTNRGAIGHAMWISASPVRGGRR